MAKLNDKLFEKVQKVAHSVKEGLRARGFVVPRSKPDGSYDFDGYCVKKQETGLYKITDANNSVIIDNINLPQTAALIANDLALGKILDKNIISIDANYGFRVFDCDLYKHAASRARKRDIDQYIYYDTRCKLANDQRKNYKNIIIQQFEKLRRVR